MLVDDLDAVEAQVAAAGLTPFHHADDEAGRRFRVFGLDETAFKVGSCADGRP